MTPSALRRRRCQSACSLWSSALRHAAAALVPFPSLNDGDTSEDAGLPLESQACSQRSASQAEARQRQGRPARGDARKRSSLPASTS
mmetsp:Transcript_66828/g.209077  ORF Transcript_66828/g.209077 Transcript_66828/m.209077 type:complete len:87 (-) Transcript_66828:100-360(-)